MPADNKKQELRSLLAGKSTEELEELIALDFTEQEDADLNADYINTILEVIAEREGSKEKETEAAWKDFQEYYQLRKQEELESGTTVESSPDHHCKTEQSQRTRRSFCVLRYAIVAAAAVILLCGTAFGWNIFQAIADWTTETFYFLTGREAGELDENDALRALRLVVEKYSDTPSVPKWAPDGTEKYGGIRESDRKDRYIIQSSFVTDEREFTVRIVIHTEVPEDYIGAYQKDFEIVEEYEVCGITHYIMRNIDTLSAMWTNECVEGYIQGYLNLNEMRQMIDSIYEE